jgi:hypothetical protein
MSTNVENVIEDIKDILTINVFINEVEVLFIRRKVTGAEIKQRAIQKGVHIQANFVLHLEHANAPAETIPDDKEIRIVDDMKFTAIAPDDNS